MALSKDLDKFLQINFDYVGVDKEMKLDNQMSTIDRVKLKRYVEKILGWYKKIITDHLTNVYDSAVTVNTLNFAVDSIKEMIE